jgi:hypothetical protein
MTDRTSTARCPQDLERLVTVGIGGSPLGPDGTLKVRPASAYSSGPWAEMDLTHALVGHQHICGVPAA